MACHDETENGCGYTVIGFILLLIFSIALLKTCFRSGYEELDDRIEAGYYTKEVNEIHETYRDSSGKEYHRNDIITTYK